MEALKAIKIRSGIQSFDGRPIQDDDTIKKLEAGRLVPSVVSVSIRIIYIAYLQVSRVSVAI